jgi:hypothetical protein
VTDANVSVSLGLIVTELVINALKHAFPGHRPGKIVVDYKSHGPNWTLSVSDNGIGMPSDTESSKPGLGTNIVEALAKRLEADVRIARADPRDDRVDRPCAACRRSYGAGGLMPTLTYEPQGLSIAVVLVVEDNPLILMAALDLVTTTGFEGVGPRAPTKRSPSWKHGGHSSGVHDVEMPGTIDGVKLAHYIRNRWPQYI